MEYLLLKVADLRHIRSVFLSNINDAFIVDLSYSWLANWFMAKEGFDTSVRVICLESNYHIYWLLRCFMRVSQRTGLIVRYGELWVLVEYLTIGEASRYLVRYLDSLLAGVLSPSKAVNERYRAK